MPGCVRPKPTAAERPVLAVDVPEGDCVTFLRRGEYRWCCTVGPWTSTDLQFKGQKYRAWTNVRVEMLTMQGSRVLKREPRKPQIGVDRTGHPRLRVVVDKQRRQLSLVAAFCWNRPTVGGGVWDGVRRLEADHLPHMTSEGGLATRVDVVGAGWVELVTPEENRRRRDRLLEAKAIFEDALALEREHAVWAPLVERARVAANGGRKRNLRQLKAADKRDSALQTVRTRLASGHDFAKVTPPFKYLTWDIDWHLTKDEEDNPYLETLFIQAHHPDPDNRGALVHRLGAPASGSRHGAMTPRQALIAHCTRLARLKRAEALALAQAD